MLLIIRDKLVFCLLLLLLWRLLEVVVVFVIWDGVDRVGVGVDRVLVVKVLLILGKLFVVYES